MRRLACVISLVSVVLLAGCGGTPPLAQSSEVAVASSGQLPAPTIADFEQPSTPFAIGPYDKLDIDVFGIDGMQKEVQVDAGGDVSFPLAGSIHAAGSTPQKLATAIADRLRDKYVRDPQVTVNVSETVSRIMTLDGQVEKPGRYPVVGDMTLLGAVATAGGVSEFAKLREVLIFREVGKQKMLGVYDLEAIRRGNYPDPRIYPNDVIVVGDSPQRRFYKNFLQTVPLFTTPLILLLRTF